MSSERVYFIFTKVVPVKSNCNRKSNRNGAGALIYSVSEHAYRKMLAWSSCRHYFG